MLSVTVSLLEPEPDAARRVARRGIDFLREAHQLLNDWEPRRALPIPSGRQLKQSVRFSSQAQISGGKPTWTPHAYLHASA